MARNIGATLSLNNGNFFVNMKSAVNASNNLRNSLNGTTSGMKNFGNQSSGVGGVITSLASKAAVAVGAFVGVRQAIDFGKDVVPAESLNREWQTYPQSREQQVQN